MIKTPKCPSCSLAHPDAEQKKISSFVWRCTKCQCLHGTVPSRAYISLYVKLAWHPAPDEVKDIQPFNFTYGTGDGSNARVHGWFDVASKLIVQIG